MPEILTVGLDLDNTYYQEADPFLRAINTQFGLNLRREDYSENHPLMYGKVPRVAYKMTRWFHSSGIIGDLEPLDHAYEVVGRLREKGVRFVGTTSRQEDFAHFTHYSARKHLSHVLDPLKDIHFTGFYGNNRLQRTQSSKAVMYRLLGCHVGVDDFVKHTVGATNPVDASGELVYEPIPAILVGDEPWNQAAYLSPGTTRCLNWLQIERVLEYYLEQKREYGRILPTRPLAGGADSSWQGNDLRPAGGFVWQPTGSTDSRGDSALWRPETAVAASGQ